MTFFTISSFAALVLVVWSCLVYVGLLSRTRTYDRAYCYGMIFVVAFFLAGIGAAIAGAL